MLAPATLAALQSTRAIPNRGVFYVADPISSIETRSFPNSARRYPRDFTFYVANPSAPFITSSFFLLTLLRRFQLGAHRRHTDLAGHEARIGVGDRHALPVSF